MKRIDRNTEPYINILLLPFLVFYWLGTLIGFITYYCNDRWEEWERINN